MDIPSDDPCLRRFVRPPALPRRARSVLQFSGIKSAVGDASIFVLLMCSM